MLPSPTERHSGAFPFHRRKDAGLRGSKLQLSADELYLKKAATGLSLVPHPRKCLEPLWTTGAEEVHVASVLERLGEPCLALAILPLSYSEVPSETNASVFTLPVSSPPPTLPAMLPLTHSGSEAHVHTLEQ